MSKKIYVGNLSFQTTEGEITQAFSDFGPVESVSIITVRDTGRSKGFAFVQMAEGADVDKAMSALNGTEVGGRKLTVNAKTARKLGLSLPADLLKRADQVIE